MRAGLEKAKLQAKEHTTQQKRMEVTLAAASKDIKATAAKLETAQAKGMQDCRNELVRCTMAPSNLGRQ